MPSKDTYQPHLLVVDDDDRLRHLLVKFLKEQGFLISQASNAEEAYDILEHFRFDLLLLDIMMPGETGLSLTERLRDKNNPIPILLLTAMGDVGDRIEGLKKGADDYLPKPFEPEELLLRIQSILKRSQQSKTLHEMTIGGLHFHKQKGLLRKGDAPILLTDAETKLLRIFAEHPNKTISREELAEKTSISTNLRTIDVHVTRLRKKIEEDSKNPRFLQTIRYKGYVLWTE
jgi:two-component system phosphate regulon response regulator OmpR